LRLRDKIPGLNHLEYGLLRIIAGIINLLPISVSTWIARRIGGMLYFFLGKRKKIAFQNISFAYASSKTPEEKRKIVRECFRNLATSLMEFFRISKMLKDADKRVKFYGKENMDAAFAKGKGVIFVISHLGPWECLSFMPNLLKYPCSVIARPIRNPLVYKWIWGLRESTSLININKNKSIKKVLSELKRNHLVGVAIDQWPGREGTESQFFGQDTLTTSIPARLARKTGAALVPGYCIRVDSGYYEIHLKPEIPLSETESWEVDTTNILNQQLEKDILTHPEQWTWGHRRWKKFSKQ